MPSPRTILENRHFSVFGKLLHDPNLWHLNRRSAAGAFGVGLFMMYMPPFGQMLMAAAAAIAAAGQPAHLRGPGVDHQPADHRRPCSTSPTWWAAGSLGAPADGLRPGVLVRLAQLGGGARPPGARHAGLRHRLLGAGYLGVQALWRWSLVREIRHRKERYRAMAGPTTSPDGAKAKTPSSSRQT